MIRIAVLMLALIGVSNAGGQGIASSQGTLAVMPIVEDLITPWGFGFLPDGRIVITERGGRILLAKEGSETIEVDGGPEVVARGQGGLLDVMVPRDFTTTRELYFSYSKKQEGGGAGTAVALAVLDESGERLVDLSTIFEIASGSGGGRHFGSRLLEAEDGTLFLTVGDRGDRPSAQDLSRENGSVVRIERNGSIPPDNPFIERADARPGIWSFGHRNAQGMAFGLDGRLWTVEHGARGGDEINHIERGKNYGWPVISYGTHYSGSKIGEGTARQGMEQPAFHWDPSIAPSGMIIYSGELWPEWRGDFFVGSLKFNMISRLEGDTSLREAERLMSDETLRVRDIKEAPDGSIWFLSVGKGALYRIAPAGK
ncbi:PQQ-dependent sugar dehydrogenase [Thioalkalivibrio sp. HK1]|uniref:PQQ-dependent sugar dehydrogenase n=1 Tax=Thioalkalivibrio sp. HK1 TaxID=1469245 RepID=UPI00047270DB|nr:PQQ-dependent sugar dehydrogenase [Thioalkalivibrio sp. HK1]